MGIITNADRDLRLTPLERAKKEVDEKNNALIRDAVERAKREGPKPQLITSEQQVTTTYDRLAEQSSFVAAERQSIIPIAVRVGPEYPGGFHYILTDADYEAVRQGYYCQRCLIKQSDVWRPACHVCGTERGNLDWN